MKKIKFGLFVVFCFALPQFLLAAPPPEKILNAQQKTLSPAKGLTVVYEPTTEEGSLDSFIFLWAIENDSGNETQWNCFIDKSTKISYKGNPMAKEAYAKWKENGQKATSADIKFDYSFHNRKLCKEISLK